MERFQRIQLKKIEKSKIKTSWFINYLFYQIELLESYMPQTSGFSRVNIEKEIFMLHARILQLKKYHHQNLPIKIEVFESSINDG